MVFHPCKNPQVSKNLMNFQHKLNLSGFCCSHIILIVHIMKTIDIPNICIYCYVIKRVPIQ